MTELCHDYFFTDLKPSNHILTKENPNLTETLERDWLRVSADITFAFTAILADLPRQHLHNPDVVGQDKSKYANRLLLSSMW